LETRFLEDRNGWELRLAPYALSANDTSRDVAEWEPEFLSQGEFVLARLAVSGPVKISDIVTSGADRAQIELDLSALEAKGLIGRHLNDPDTFSLLVEQLGSGVLPDGRYFAGENASGRVERWILRKMGGGEPHIFR